MLIIGYRFGIRSERRLCEEVQLNLAYRWFCRIPEAIFRRNQPCLSSRVFQQTPFPLQRAVDDDRQIVIGRCPPQYRSDLVSDCDQDRGVTRPAFHFNGIDGLAICLLHRR